MNSPLISVIIPIYKVEDYLRECVDSVLGQTYRNLEVILVDDGSPDNCGAICDYYAAKDARIKVIHKENGGLSDARNAGLDLCTGEYISFVDSDDVVHPQFLETLYQALQQTNADVSFCDYLDFSGEYNNVKVPHFNIDIQVFNSSDILHGIYDENWYPKNVVMWNKLYARRIFETLRFPKGLLHEDEYVFTDVFKDRFIVVYTNQLLYFYRERENSIMKIFNYSRVHSKLKALDYRADFFQTENLKQLYHKTQSKKHDILLYHFLSGNKDEIQHYIDKTTFWNMLWDSHLNWKSRIIFLKKYLIK